jgi:phospholipid/cholesterol/gamma-HCH transport system substrate-binding protein
MSKEMKVGLVVFMAIAFLGALVFISGGARLGQYGYSFGIVFLDAMGLDPGAPVLVSGVESGKVDNIELMEEGVLVRVSVKGHVIIPSDSRFTIDTGGLLGEPRVKVTRGSSSAGITQGDVVAGTIPPSFDEILADIRKSLAGVQVTFSNINSFLAKLTDAADDFQVFSREAKDQVKRAGDSFSGLTERLDLVVEENRIALSQSLRTLSSVLENLDGVVRQFDEGGTSGRDLRQMVVRIGDAASSVEELIGRVEGALFDEELGAGSRIQQAKDIAGKANRIISDIEDISFEGSLGIHGATSGPAQGDLLADISLWISSRSRNMGLLIGAEDIGAEPGVTAALGFNLDRLRLWGGAVRGYAGAGVMFFPSGEKGPFSIGAQWWDEDGGSWSIDGRYRLSEKWGIFYRYLQRDKGSADSAGFFYRF